jgi:chromosome segregation ATPase
VVQTHEFEKDRLQRCIFDLEGTVAKFEEELRNAKKENSEIILQLRNRVTSLEAELNDKSRKLKDKNKTITELLNNL